MNKVYRSLSLLLCMLLTCAFALGDVSMALAEDQSADELVNVKGVGLKTVERNRDRIVVGGGAAGKPAAAARPAAKSAATGAPGKS